MARKCFVEETTVHGLKDLAEAKWAFGRSLWIAVAVVCLAGLACQGTQLFAIYLNQKTGSRIGVWEPNQFPEISVCPSTWENSDDLLSKNSNASFVNEYIRGYFPVGSYVEEYISGSSDAVQRYSHLLKHKMEAESLIDNIYNGSLEQYTLVQGMSAKNVIKEAFTMPRQYPIELTRYVNWHGLCFNARIVANFSKLQQQYNHFLIKIDPRDLPKSHQPKLFSNYITIKIGGMDENGVIPPTSTTIKHFRFTYISLIPRGIKIYGTRRRPCSKRKDWTMSDYKWCEIEFGVSEKCHNTCQLFLPSSSHKKEKIMPGGAKVLCNVHNFRENHCLKEAPDIPYDELQDKCPRPCIHEFYETVIGPPKTYNLTFLHFSLKDPDVGTYVKEYPLLTFATFASNIGGISSLYCGASIISYVQAMYFLGKYLKHKYVQKIGERQMTYKH